MKNFLLSYVKETNKDLENDTKIADEMRDEWKQMLAFIHKYFPEGFKKKGPGRKVPRVRFEALAVGVGLALGENPSVVPKDLSWLDSKEFKDWTTSDASNNRANLIGRVEYVRDRLLGK